MQRYKCKEPKCIGVWATWPLSFNGEYGKLLVPHSIPFDKHNDYEEKQAIEKYTKALFCPNRIIEQSDYLTLPQVKKLITTLSLNDPNLSATEIMAIIHRNFPNHDIISGKKVNGIVTR